MSYLCFLLIIKAFGHQTFKVLMWTRITFRTINNTIPHVLRTKTIHWHTMHYKSLRVYLWEASVSSEPGAVDFSHVTYFQTVLIFWHIKDVQRVSSLKSIIKRMLLRFPELPWKQLTTGRLWEAGMCFRAAGCHRNWYGDLHKYSSTWRAWLCLMINSARVAPARMELKQCHWEQRMRTFVCRPRYHQPRSG